MGVLAASSGPKRGSTGNEHLLWTLDDLEGHAVQVYLFGAACQGARTVQAGMVCFLTNPRLLPQRGGSSAAAQPLSVSQPYQVLQAGFAADFARCNAPVRGGGACNQPFGRAGGKWRFCHLHRGGGGGGGGAVAARVSGGSGAQQQQYKPALPQRRPTFMSVGNGRAGGGGGLIVRPAGVGGGPPVQSSLRQQQQQQAKGGGGKGQAGGGGRVQQVLARIDKNCVSYKAGFKSKTDKAAAGAAGAAGAAAPTAALQPSTLVPRVMAEGGHEARSSSGSGSGSGGSAAFLAVDERRRDGSVVVPEASQLFAKGADGVKLAEYLHKGAVAQEQRRQRRYAVEDQRSAQARSQLAKVGGGREGLILVVCWVVGVMMIVGVYIYIHRGFQCTLQHPGAHQARRRWRRLPRGAAGHDCVRAGGRGHGATSSSGGNGSDGGGEGGQGAE